MEQQQQRGWVLQAFSLLVLLSCFQLPAMAAADEEERGDLVLQGDAKCTRCHDEDELKPILSIGQSMHGTVADGRTPTCTSCHGASEAHLGGSESDDDRPPVDVQFGMKSPTPVAERNGACLSCHQGGERIHWAQGSHSANDVSCSSCHQVHNKGHDKVRERKTQAEVCFGCHKKQRMDYVKFSRHPIEEGKVVCSDCHNPHGSAGEKNLVRDTVVETCYQCHAEKRGPFIFDHLPVTEDCSNCHNPHGSNINAMLVARSPMLCQRCHEGTSHRGGIPAIEIPPTERSSHLNAPGRGCLNCHTNIHGSNNPAARRSFRE